MAVSRLTMHLGRTERKRKALHMLILSGVVRPSHIALRYTTLLSPADEQTNGSQNNSPSPTHTLHCLYHFITSLPKRITQLLAREPQFVRPSLFKSRHAATSRMCLRS